MVAVLAGLAYAVAVAGFGVVGLAVRRVVDCGETKL
jgi:hypothetical protein